MDERPLKGDEPEIEKVSSLPSPPPPPQTDQGFRINILDEQSQVVDEPVIKIDIPDQDTSDGDDDPIKIEILYQ